MCLMIRKMGLAKDQEFQPAPGTLCGYCDLTAVVVKIEEKTSTAGIGIAMCTTHKKEMERFPIPTIGLAEDFCSCCFRPAIVSPLRKRHDGPLLLVCEWCRSEFWRTISRILAMQTVAPVPHKMEKPFPALPPQLHLVHDRGAEKRLAAG